MPISLRDIKLWTPQNPHEPPGLFDGLDEDGMQLLLNNSSLQDYPAGRLLIQQGDPPTHLYYVIEGILKTFRTDIEGGEAPIRLLKKGDTCMDAVIFMGGPSPISVQVLESAKVLLLPEAFIRAYVLKNPQFATNLLRIVTKHYKNALHQLDSIITKPPVQRLGYYLLKLHLEQKSENLDIVLPFRKALIANHLGMTPETFSRALKEIKKSGIDIDQDRITLRDAYALCHFCDADTAFLCSADDKENCPTCQFKH